MTDTICYQRYSTAFKINAVLADKNTQLKSLVPASTISYWRKQNFEEYLGFDLNTQTEKNKIVFKAIVQNKRYAEICRGLLLIINLLDFIINSSRRRKSLFRKNKDGIIGCFDELKKYFKVSAIEKRLRITSAKITRWKAEGKCKLSVIRLCLTLNPQQLTFDEQLRFKEYLLSEENRHLPTNHKWSKAQREGLMIAKQTAYKYKNEIMGREERKKRKAKKISIHASRPFEILHMDSTPLVLKNKEKIYIHFVMDNFSRAVLGGVVSHSSKSLVVAENLRAVLKNYHLFYKPFTLYCDGGPENEGEVNGLLCDDKIKIRKIVANYLDETTNNMAEAWHRKFKQVILKIYKVKDSEELAAKLPEMIEFANSLYLPVLKTLSPNEVLQGKKYEDLQVEEEMAETRIKRIEVNGAFNCKARCKN